LTTSTTLGFRLFRLAPPGTATARVARRPRTLLEGPLAARVVVGRTSRLDAHRPNARRIHAAEEEEEEDEDEADDSREAARQKRVVLRWVFLSRAFVSFSLARLIANAGFLLMVSISRTISWFSGATALLKLSPARSIAAHPPTATTRASQNLGSRNSAECTSETLANTPKFFHASPTANLANGNHIATDPPTASALIHVQWFVRDATFTSHVTTTAVNAATPVAHASQGCFPSALDARGAPSAPKHTAKHQTP
jgi:hypothetical protein